MRLKVIITAPARLEIAVAVKSYEEQRPSVGVRFWLEFQQVVTRLRNSPNLYPSFGERGNRRAPLRDCPHVIYYRIAGGEVRILGVAHGAVNPETVKARFG